MLERFVDRERISYFLAGLDFALNSVRVQVLGKEDLPSLKEMISIIVEENRRGVMLDSQPIEGSALEQRNRKTEVSALEQRQYMLHLQRKTTPHQGQPARSFRENHKSLSRIEVLEVDRSKVKRACLTLVKRPA